MLRKSIFLSSLVVTTLMAGCPSSNPTSATTVTFRDDFTNGLGAGWTIERQDNSFFLPNDRPGFIRLVTTTGGLSDQTLPNVIVRPASGDFILDNRVEFAPDQDRQFAGLLVTAPDGSGVIYGTTRGANGRGLAAVAGAAGSSSTSTSVAGYTSDSVYLRLERTGSTFTLSYSSDGTAFSSLATGGSKVTVTLPNDVNVGFFVTNGDCTDNCNTNTPADFDFFQISVRN